MKIGIATALFVTLTASVFVVHTADGSEPAPIYGRIVDEAGNAISDATVTAIDQAVTVDESAVFHLGGDQSPVIRIAVAAPGYYDFVHTIGRPDVMQQGGRIADIELVKKVPGRRLLVFAGDTMLTRRYFEPRDGEPVLVRRSHVAEDAGRLLEVVRPYIALADFASANLETQLAPAPLTEHLPKSVTFNSPIELASILKSTGFDYVALGNNHTFDFLDDGLESTLAALDRTGLGYSGAGSNDAAARRPYVTDVEGNPFAFLSYVGWPGTFSPSQVAEHGKGGAALGDDTVFAEDLEALPARATAVLQYHSGLEYTERPAMTERTRLRLAIDEGADLALGHHAHVLQGFEIYKSKLIAYSLGNFLFDQYHYTPHLGMLLFVWMDGDSFHRAEIVPMHINGYVPTPAAGAFRFAILNRLARLSASFGVCMHDSGAHAVIDSEKVSCESGDLVLAGDSASGIPVHLGTRGMSPLQAVSVASNGRQYRLGTDILRRGDFEYAGRFGTQDRSWIESDQVAIVDDETRMMRISVASGAQPVRAGMKVFERAFTPSNTATLSGRVRVDGDATLRFLLQRRRVNDSLEDALVDGPLVEIGSVRSSSGDWQSFTIDHTQPRTSTRSIRFLIEVDDVSSDGAGAAVDIDDLAWIEWRTPWLGQDNAAVEARHATHVQLRQ